MWSISLPVSVVQGVLQDVLPHVLEEAKHGAASCTLPPSLAKSLVLTEVFLDGQAVTSTHTQNKHYKYIHKKQHFKYIHHKECGFSAFIIYQLIKHNPQTTMSIQEVSAGIRELALTR